ncbi:MULTISPECIES: hypothetical protein [unclassified Pseudomonas]|uniref:hypothetical protein n=1 Tax=unclassified Pseudomonas TaxID=196821 RepID=UPI0011AFBD03|nr:MULTISPECIES: hypothetical protein [unclassified Pseudomonas]
MKDHDYIGIVLDESTKRQPGRYHPVDGIEYGEMADGLPKPPRRTNYDRYYDEYRARSGYDCTGTETWQANGLRRQHFPKLATSPR